MPLTLNADGKRTNEPTAADIARTFESLERGRFRLFGFRGPGISLIILQRDESHMLTATGTYSDGFMLGHNDGDPDLEHVTDMNKPIPPADMVKIFQAYARGDDWGHSTFNWDVNDLRGGKTSRILVWLLVGGFVAYMGYVIVRQLLK
jgi:hypothetical protein